MKIKFLLSIAVAFTALFAMSCDDDVSTIGETILPPGDGISLAKGEAHLTASPFSLKDRLYVDAKDTDVNVMLGELNDPIFGKIKADFLSEFFTANEKFILGVGDDAVIDSVKLRMIFFNSSFTGDSISPMGVTVYQLNKDLPYSKYVDSNPSDYCDMKTVLGEQFFSVKDLPNLVNESTNKAYGRILQINIDRSCGQDLYDEWKRNPDVLKNMTELRKFMKGVYVTSNFNDKAIIEFSSPSSTISLDIYYTYKKMFKKVHEPTVDSIGTSAAVLPFPIGAEARKLNRVTNTPMSEVVGIDKTDRTFLKSPSDIATRVTIPLGKIKRDALEKTGSEDFIINSAVFKLIGFTEEEDKMNITKRPNALLFVPEDSVANFFSKKKRFADMPYYTAIMVRDNSNNTYNFFSQTRLTVSNNIATLLNHWLEKDKVDEELRYLAIPISTPLSGSSSAGYVIDESAFNLYSPTAAILRTNEQFMKMSLLYSKHNENIKKE